MKILLVMTLAAVRKITSRLTPVQKRVLAEELLAQSQPRPLPNPSLAEIQQRAVEVFSGKARTVSKADFDKSTDRLMSKIKRSHALRAAQQPDFCAECAKART
jgi:hypothetical protein